MGRPRKHPTADGDALRTSVDGAELRGYIERIECINEEIKDRRDDRGAIFQEVKSAGYDTTTVRTIIKRRAMDPDKRYTTDQLLDLYMSAFGDFAGTELGRARAERILEGAHAG